MDKQDADASQNRQKAILEVGAKVNEKQTERTAQVACYQYFTRNPFVLNILL